MARQAFGCLIFFCGITILITFCFHRGYLEKLNLEKSTGRIHDYSELLPSCSSNMNTRCASTYIKREAERYLPSSSLKSWNQGVITVLQPQVTVNCSKILEGEKIEVARVREAMSSWRSALTSQDLLHEVQNCSWLREYMTHNLYNSELERDFPLAFTLVVHDSPEQILRLLRVLFRPQNSFCIHCDAKSPHTKLFQSIARCFENVVVPSVLERVIWGHSSILEAQMKCMTELIKRRESQTYKWQYLLNLCGKELPLATNREMVLQLIKLNGTSNIKPQTISVNQTELYSRIKYRVKLGKKTTRIHTDRKSRLDNPPFDVSKYYHKSSGYHALSFQFSYHIVHNDTAVRIRKFFRDCKNSEEHYYATLFMMPGVPGGYKETMRNYFYVISTFWMNSHHCTGKAVHRVCITTAGDLAKILLYGRNRFFHNKYFMEWDHSVMDCMEERLVARNKKEYQTDCTRNDTQQKLLAMRIGTV